MRTFAGLVVSTTTATMFQGLPQPSARIDAWHTVPSVCRVIGGISCVSEKHSARRRERSQPFRRAYPKRCKALGATTCYDTLRLGELTVTSRRGRYSLGEIVPRTYGPGFGFDGPRYAYPLRYGPRKTADCDGHGFYAGFDEYAEPAPSREAVVE
jgi:hypothetical protein